MISIARHIELLLLEHDCVIVPGLGGFITNHADARYTGEEEGLFLPPYRTIGFNQQLQVNDGLLVQSYMAAYDTSYPAANLQMEKDLEKMMNELEMKGEYELENIGIIKKGLNQNISFISPETGALTPSRRNSKQIPEEKETSKKAAEQETKRGDVTIHFNRRWLDVGIAAAAAVLLFFCFSYLVMNQTNGNSDTIVAAFPTMDKVAIKSAKPATVQQVATPAKNEAEKPVPAKAEPAKAIEAEEIPAQVENARFAIVLATYVSQDNAEKFIKDLAKEGLSEGRYVKNGKVSRVLYSEYADESAAQQALNKLRQQNAAFAEAWILEL